MPPLVCGYICPGVFESIRPVGYVHIYQHANEHHHFMCGDVFPSGDEQFYPLKSELIFPFCYVYGKPGVYDYICPVVQDTMYPTTLDCR